MKLKKLFQLIFIVSLTLLFSECQKGGNFDIYGSGQGQGQGQRGGGGSPGGGGGGNESSPSNGDLYGDLFQILRDVDGVPILKEIGGTYYVQPYDELGLIPFTIEDEGEPVYDRLPIEVEISRLNIIRAPERVLDNAMKEVNSAIVGNDVMFDPGGRIVGKNGLDYITVESPLGNMAVYKQHIMPDQNVGALFSGANSVTGFCSNDFDDMALAAACLAGATNKETEMTSDKLVYFNTFAELYGASPLMDEVGNKFYNYNGFMHCRNMYKHRWLQVTRINAAGFAVTTIETVFDFMGWQDYVAGNKSGFEQFIDAVNDATHVLYEVHEDSYVIWLPEHNSQP